MNINPINVQRAYEMFKTQKVQDKKTSETAEGTEKSEKTSEKDNVTLSNDGMFFNNMIKKLKDMPDVRVDRVKELKQRIDDGTYKADNEKTAENILNGALYDKKA